MSRKLIRRMSLVIVLIVGTLAIILAGCATKAPVRSTRVQATATPVPCTPSASPQAYVSVDSKEVCPSMDAGIQAGGYEDLLYIYQGGVMNIATKGVADRPVLVAVTYEESFSDGTSRSMVVFQRNTVYEVGIVPATCPDGRNATAQPLAVEIYVPAEQQTDPTAITGFDATLVAATDPSFGLPPQRTFSEVADALCA